jgi:hypothetical protein
MLASFSCSFASPISLAIALILLVLFGVVVAVRRPLMGRAPMGLLIVGGLLIAMAAGEPRVNRRSAGSICVMVDLSASTRGATFRDRAALDFRVHQLLGEQPYRLVAFADSTQSMPNGAQLPDLPADHTVFAPPSSDAVVLFSDGRFDLPATGPPTYPVIDPAMNNPGDAAVVQMESTGPAIVASIRNDGGNSRSLHWTGATPVTPAAVTGSYLQYAKPDGSGEITVALAPGDRWPEPAPKTSTERWWVGADAPAGWRQLAPGELPASASDYLSASVIVLRNIPADALSSTQQRRLTQYVRDLGGSLAIVGGDHAFAAGDYNGTPLDDLSPLASSPPEPEIHWMLLVDGSGSMAGEGGGGTAPWQMELNAITALLPRLPPNDLVSAGSFAESLSWWTTRKSAEQTALLHLPPASIFPHGPTNLAPVLQQITDSADGSAIVQLLVMTDAETELPDAGKLSVQMAAKRIHLNVLAIGHGSALPALRRIAAATDGSVVEQLDPKEWVSASQILLKQALPTRYEHTPITIEAQIIPEWNHTWLRDGASAIMKATNTPLAASWQRGFGRVTAIAYPADIAATIAVTSQIETPPRDPRFSVSWEAGSVLKIRVNAIAGDELLNGQAIQLQLREADQVGQSSKPATIPQTGPGLYELSVPSPRRPMIAAVLHDSQVLERIAVAGRYAPEFDHIGNDIPALQELANRTGGQVIAPNRVAPIDFRWPEKTTSIAPVLAFGAFIFIGAAMVLHRR